MGRFPLACVVVAAVAVGRGAPPLDADIQAVASLAGEPSAVAAAGERDGAAILTIENPGAFDPSDQKRRLVIVGGLDGDASGADAAVAAVRWFKTSASADAKRRWTISALPFAQFDAADKQSLVRWVTFQAPDVVVIAGGGGDALRDALRTVPFLSLAATAGPSIDAILSRPIERSALHADIVARVQRQPPAIARLLAARYPETPSISYIPAVSWVNALRLNEPALRQRVLDQIKPWHSGERKLFGDRIQLTSVAGAIVFAELAKQGDEAAAKLAIEAADLALAKKPDGTAQYGGGWTDDMFMAGTILSRTAALPGRAGDLDRAAELLMLYAQRLQQPNGLFNHAVDGPAAWGRGNGFAAMGLAEILAAMPAAHANRAAILDIYRRQMSAVKANQSPDGSWRNIVDAPGAYREETATAMLLTAMARGVRLGWLDTPYRPVVDRAWRALAAHVALDGTIVDVCASTGGGPTRKYYFDRPAITGADDRGGAMALLASMEISLK